MKNLNPGGLIVLLMASCCIASVSKAADAPHFKVQQIKNLDAVQTANDLHIVFKGGEVDHRFVSVNKGKNRKDGKNAERGALGDDKISIDFSKDQLGLNIESTDLCSITWEGADLSLDVENSYWTRFGAELKNSFWTLGTPPKITDDGGHVKFSNLGGFPLIYTDLFFSIGNSLDHFTEDLVTDSTGTAVLGLPSTFTLNPGDSLVLPFTSVIAGTYQLAMVSIADARNPDDKFFAAAAAAAIPEADTMGAVTLLGCLVIETVRRRKKKGLFR